MENQYGSNSNFLWTKDKSVVKMGINQERGGWFWEVGESSLETPRNQELLFRCIRGLGTEDYFEFKKDVGSKFIGKLENNIELLIQNNEI